jgi:hypothetical protein
MDGMTVGMIRYDAARKALAACHRVDEVKKIHDKATALLAYARQAGDLTLQNQAAEIRILSERRAGQLLIDMEKNPGAKGIGRTPKGSTQKGRYPRATALPPTLEELNITKVQSSKWQRLARLVDDETFEEALSQAKDQYGELTTAGVLRMVKESVRPSGKVVGPDINVVAAELVRDIESANRKEKLKEVVESRNRLNPTIRKNLIFALKNVSKDLADFGGQLSIDFQDFPKNGKCHQRLVREQMAQLPEPDLDEKRLLASDLKNAIVREISFNEAKQVILANEYLAKMNSATLYSVGLFFRNPETGKEYLGGVECFGATAGSNVAASICGAEHKEKVLTLVRGACCHWVDRNVKSKGKVHTGAAASFLITRACNLMAKKGFNVICSFSDPAASEIGTIYSALNHYYCGLTQPTEQFRTPDGKVHDSRQVSGLARDRRGGTLKYKRTRAQQKKLLIEQGCEFFAGMPKHRYVGFYGDRRIKRMLRAALKWEVLPYPKREQPSEIPPKPVALASPATSVIG